VGKQSNNNFQLVDHIADLATDYQNRIENSKEQINTDDLYNEILSRIEAEVSPGKKSVD
jgi:hypothetical protein